MSLIQSINGDLLLRLASASGSSSSTPSSTIGGRGSSANFDGGTDFASGFETGAAIFSRSSERLSGAYLHLSNAYDNLSQLSDLLDHMIELAKSAQSEALTPSDRARLNGDFQSTVAQFRSLSADSVAVTTDGESEDLLLKSDLSDLLKDAGVDVTSSSQLAQAFQRTAGADGRLAYKAITAEDVLISTNSGTEFVSAPTGSDPLEQDISTIGGATIAATTLGEFRKDLDNDLSSLNTVVTELNAALRFANTGTAAFANAGNLLSGGTNADALAKQIVDAIQRYTNDNALAAHSDIDRQLAIELLGE